MSRICEAVSPRSSSPGITSMVTVSVWVIPCLSPVMVIVIVWSMLAVLGVTVTSAICPVVMDSG